MGRVGGVEYLREVRFLSPDAVQPLIARIKREHPPLSSLPERTRKYLEEEATKGIELAQLPREHRKAVIGAAVGQALKRLRWASRFGPLAKPKEVNLSLDPIGNLRIVLKEQRSARRPPSKPSQPPSRRFEEKHRFFRWRRARLGRPFPRKLRGPIAQEVSVLLRSDEALSCPVSLKVEGVELKRVLALLSKVLGRQLEASAALASQAPRLSLDLKEARGGEALEAIAAVCEGRWAKEGRGFVLVPDSPEGRARRALLEWARGGVLGRALLEAVKERLTSDPKLRAKLRQGPVPESSLPAEIRRELERVRKMRQSALIARLLAPLLPEALRKGRVRPLGPARIVVVSPHAEEVRQEKRWALFTPCGVVPLSPPSPPIRARR